MKTPPGPGVTAATSAVDVKREAARLGLLKGPRPADMEERPRQERLGELFVSLGPLGVAFGRYLSRREDLDFFSAGERRWLAGSWGSLEPEPDSGSEADLDLEAHLAHLAAALGPRLSLLADISRQPEMGDWSGQWHRARCVDGRPVRIFVSRPGLAREIEVTSERLRDLAPLIGLPPTVVADFFLHVVEPRADLHRHTEWLKRLYRRMVEDASESPMAGFDLGSDFGIDLADVGFDLPKMDPRRRHALQIPELIHELTVGPVFTVDDPAGLLGLLSGGPLSSRGVEAARLLASSFIGLLADHGVLVDEVYLARLEDGRPWLLDATFIELAPPSARRFLDFLRATASEQPREVAGVWRCEIEESGVDPDHFRSRLRQATPRRGAAEQARESTLAYAMSYWRGAAQGGVVLGSPWRAALAAASGVEGRLGEWDPDGDALAAALVEDSWREGWRRFRAMAAPMQIASMLDRHTTAFLEAPAIIDRALNAEGSAPRAPGNPRESLGYQDSKSRARARRRAGRENTSSRWRGALPFLPALFAVSLVARFFPEIATVATLLFVILTLGLLREILR